MIGFQVIGLLYFIFSGNLYSQNLPYGLSVNLNHNATLISQTMTQNKDAVIKSPTQTTSYAYDFPLSATEDFGSSGSSLKAAIVPGLIRCSWLGSSSVADGVGNAAANMYSRSDLNLALQWNDTITVASSHIPRGTEVTVYFSHSLHGNISPDTIAPYNAFLNIRAAATFYSTVEQKTSEFTTDQSIDSYRVTALKTRIGDTITYSMWLTVNGSMHTEVASGILPENSVSSTYINVGGFDSNRLGIRAADTNVILTSASGYTYPSHAMSPTKVATSLANLIIKKVDYVSTPRTVAFIVDAIPGAKYVLQRSIGGNLGSWTDVGTPVTPLDFGELALTDSFPSESSSFWRIATTPLP